jgi:hypothetical protein
MGQEVGAATIPNLRCTASPSKVITGRGFQGSSVLRYAMTSLT